MADTVAGILVAFVGDVGIIADPVFLTVLPQFCRRMIQQRSSDQHAVIHHLFLQTVVFRYQVLFLLHQEGLDQVVFLMGNQNPAESVFPDNISKKVIAPFPGGSFEVPRVCERFG